MDNEKKQVTYNSSITGETQVTFDIQQYMNNRAMFIGLMCNEDGYEEPFGDDCEFVGCSTKLLRISECE